MGNLVSFGIMRLKVVDLTARSLLRENCKALLRGFYLILWKPFRISDPSVTEQRTPYRASIGWSKKSI